MFRVTYYEGLTGPLFFGIFIKPMMDSLHTSIYTRLKSMADEVSRREGCELYGLEFLNRSRVLRVYIDKNPNGANLDDCVSVSRALNLLLDVEDIIPGGAYELEVSTPGVERRLFETWQFEKAIGKTISIRLYEPVALNSKDPEVKSKAFKGELIQATDTDIEVRTEQNVLTIARTNIERAQVVLVSSAQGKPGKKR